MYMRYKFSSDIEKEDLISRLACKLCISLHKYDDDFSCYNEDYCDRTKCNNDTLLYVAKDLLNNRGVYIKEKDKNVE